MISSNPLRNPSAPGPDPDARPLVDVPLRPGTPSAVLLRLVVALAATSPAQHDGRRTRTKPRTAGVSQRAAGRRLLLAVSLCALVGAAVPVSPPRAQANEASLDLSVAQIVTDGRAKDELHGSFAAAQDSVQICLPVSAGSKLSLQVDPDDANGPGAPGLWMKLFTEGQTEILVTGTKADKSKPEKNRVKWKNVTADTTQTLSIQVGATGPGGFRLKIAASLATIKTIAASTEVLFRGAETSVEFPGQRDGAIKVKLTAPKGSKFRGKLSRVERADGSTLFDAENDDASALMADADGLFKAFFTNTASVSGHWSAKVVGKPGPAKKRVGYLNGAGVDLVPVVKSLDPSKGVHFDSAHRVTITGRDFQPGVDVRLRRNRRADIVAENVTLVSETEVTCVFNLDTRDTQSESSVGTWKCVVTNAPRFARMDPDPLLVPGIATQNNSKTFKSLSSGSITLPRGVQKDSEVWYVNFLDAFQTDLDKMGLGASDSGVELRARESVEAYVILFLRDLFRANETTGSINRTDAIPVSFVVIEPSSVAGLPGEDYNRIDVGGDWEVGDPQDADESLAWGFADYDAGNTQRDNLAQEFDDGNGLVRLGRGARTRALDPTRTDAHTDWVAATSPLRNTGLRGSDARYFDPGFAPGNQAQADRYAEIVKQVERCSREIAALVAHHILKSMGQDDGGNGPSANPTEAGNMWPKYKEFGIGDGDAANLRDLAVPHSLPGRGGKLDIGYFPLNTTQEFLMANLTTEEHYVALFKFVGGRPNAVSEDRLVQTTSTRPLNLSVNYQGISGTAPLFISQNAFYCEISVFTVRVTDTKRGGRASFVYRINVLPNVPMLPTALQNSANVCRNQVLTN